MNFSSSYSKSWKDSNGSGNGWLELLCLQTSKSMPINHNFAKYYCLINAITMPPWLHIYIQNMIKKNKLSWVSTRWKKRLTMCAVEQILCLMQILAHCRHQHRYSIELQNLLKANNVNAEVRPLLQVWVMLQICRCQHVSNHLCRSVLDSWFHMLRNSLELYKHWQFDWFWDYQQVLACVWSCIWNCFHALAVCNAAAPQSAAGFIGMKAAIEKPQAKMPCCVVITWLLKRGHDQV